MKWDKPDAFSWRYHTDTIDATIDKVSGNLGWPYMWAVYPLPKPAGRWDSIAKGECRKLAEAKAEAEAVIEAAEKERK